MTRKKAQPAVPDVADESTDRDPEIGRLVPHAARTAHGRTTSKTAVTTEPIRIFSSTVKVVSCDG